MPSNASLRNVIGSNVGSEALSTNPLGVICRRRTIGRLSNKKTVNATVRQRRHGIARQRRVSPSCATSGMESLGISQSHRFVV